MHFCSKCQNLYYLRLNANDPNKLIYYCRQCGNEDNTITADNVSISKLQIKKNEQNFSNIINKYTKLDPTLPRINNILCPYAECKTNHIGESSKETEAEKEKEREKEKELVEREIIYIRYDDVNMKYVYLCSTCDTIWKLENT